MSDVAQIKIRDVLAACTGRSNYRVVTEPAQPPSYMPRPTWTGKRECEEIAIAIRRHVDGVHHVWVKSDLICKFCGAAWEGRQSSGDGTTDVDDGPACCDKGMDAFEAVIEGAKT